MKIVVYAYWDDEAEVWIGIARSEGIATEANSLKALRQRIELVAADYFDDASLAVEIEMVVSEVTAAVAFG